MKVMFIIGILIALAYVLTMCYVVVCEIIEEPHPTEKKVTIAFIKIAALYFFVSIIYIIGHYVGGTV